MKERTAADVVDEARRARRLAEAAKSARVKIRLWEKPVVRKGLLRFTPRTPTDRVQEFDGNETRAIYEALGIVMDDHLKRARELDAQVAIVNNGADQ